MGLDGRRSTGAPALQQLNVKQRIAGAVTVTYRGAISPGGPPVAVARHFAILLCKYTDTEGNFDVDYYQRLFTTAGRGSGNVVDYFHEASNGNVDLSGNEVFDAIPIPKKRSEYVGSGVNQQGRMDLVNWAKTAAQGDGVDLSKFPGGVVVLTLPGSDVFGNDGFAVLMPESIGLGVAGHEMGHALGLEHSWSETTGNADYMDPFDMMSWQNTLNPQHPDFGVAGPLFNGINMRRMGWLDETRIADIGPGTHEVTIRPLTREDLGGYLGAQVDQYLFEFRPATGWDSAFGMGGVQVHSLNGDRSVLHFGSVGQSLIRQGGAFTRGLAWLKYDRRITVTVLSMDDEEAVLGIQVIPAEPAPYAGPGIVFGGVDVGAGGWVIVGGRIVRVPPREPILAILTNIGLLAAAEDVRDEALAARLRAHAFQQIQAEAQGQLRELRGRRGPVQ
jgi:hypothetical protein